jgi:hypothetical protein
MDPAGHPALYYNHDGRWVICSNADSQRLFDEELDGLGFQIKEWPWHLGRQQLLTDLCQGKAVACDQSLENTKPVGNRLLIDRRQMSEYDRACYRALGQIVTHAIEATGRTLSPGETEREIAGQLAHRLLHRGASIVQIMVAADGRSRAYRQAGFTSTTVKNYCVLEVTARKYGLVATACRTINFGPLNEIYRKEHDAVCKISATYIAGTWPDSLPKQILATGRRVYQIADAEHEWQLCPQGFVTGRQAIELNLTPVTTELLQSNWVVTWLASVGAARSCDTFLISEDGPRAVTSVESWPLKRIRIQGADFVRPDVLIR